MACSCSREAKKLRSLTVGLAWLGISSSVEAPVAAAAAEFEPAAGLAVPGQVPEVSSMRDVLEEVCPIRTAPVKVPSTSVLPLDGGPWLGN